VACRFLASAVRRCFSGLRYDDLPLASFLFTGPSGVGKTELALIMAKIFYGTTNSLIRIDMSEFMESNSITRLTGALPGYIGHFDGGQLTTAIRRRPYILILFDEIEKAHADISLILIQILDYGILTDAKGKTSSFKNTIIILTSNIGDASFSIKTINKPNNQ